MKEKSSPCAKNYRNRGRDGSLSQHSVERVLHCVALVVGVCEVSLLKEMLRKCT